MRPCRSLAPVIEEITKEFEGRARVAKVNVDNNKELARKYGIMSIPTLIIFRSGQLVEQMVAFTQKKALAKKIENAL